MLQSALQPIQPIRACKFDTSGKHEAEFLVELWQQVMEQCGHGDSMPVSYLKILLLHTLYVVLHECRHELHFCFVFYFSPNLSEGEVRLQ